MKTACSVPWCVFTPAPDDATCAVHRQHPVLPRESPDAWRKRIASEVRAATRAKAARERASAIQDDADARKGVRR